jgi:hypothetical protein
MFLIIVTPCLCTQAAPLLASKTVMNCKSCSVPITEQDSALVSGPHMLRCLNRIYKSRERGREDVSINIGISERRKSLALSGDGTPGQG